MNKSVNDFVKDLVQSPRELPIFPTSWDKVEEQYVPAEEQAQDQEKSEEE